MKRTWKPTIAGILNIVAGTWGLFIGISMCTGVWHTITHGHPEWWLAVVLFTPPLVLGILSVVGGYFALRRRVWGLAIAGSIASLFLTLVLGIVAIVLVKQSKGEFS